MLSELPDLQGRASAGNGGSTNLGHGEAASICGGKSHSLDRAENY